MQIDKSRVREALARTQQKMSSLRHEVEMFYMFIFGIAFGVLSGMMASYADNVVRGSLTYPSWYTITLFSAFAVTLGVIGWLYLSLRQRRKDIELMEHHFEEMMGETSSAPRARR